MAEEVTLLFGRKINIKPIFQGEKIKVVKSIIAEIWDIQIELIAMYGENHPITKRLQDLKVLIMKGGKDYK